MTLSELKMLVPATLIENIETHYQEFCRITDSQDIGEFITYLYKEKYLDRHVYQELQNYDLIELTSIEETLGMELATDTSNRNTSSTAMFQDLEETANMSDMDATMAVTESDTTSSHSPESTRHEMLGTVGEGAMGQVLLAKDRNLQRKVAYKQIHRQIAANRRVLSRFLIEAQITAQLEHPNIIPIYNLEVTAEGSIGYSMKLIQGKTLKDLIRETRECHQNKQPLDDVHSQSALLGHFLKVCDAIYYAHRKGVIHRDLKPANIMIGPYHEVYVMDWGIAKLIKGHEEPIDAEIAKMIEPDKGEPPMERTQLGQILGTPRYMSPQQAAGKNDTLDGHSDQFALGLILFEILTLKPAFNAKTPVDLLKKVLKAEKEPMQHITGKVKIAGELQAIVHKATARKTEQRYESVQDFAEDIRRHLRGESVLARPDNLFQKTLRWMSHHRQATLTGMLLLLLICASVIIFSLYHRQMAILEVREREKKISPFLTSVAHKSQQLDSQFLKFEALLEGLSSVATEALQRGKASNEPYYMEQDFTLKPQSPPDFGLAPRYGKAISTEWPVFRLAPGVSEPSVRSLIQRLSPLRHDFKRLFLKSVAENQPFLLEQTTTRKQIAVTGVPVVWAYVGLKEGIMFAYPGKSDYPTDYDPRQRPWYKQSKNQYGTLWGQPYLDIQGQGLMLPCTTALHDDHNHFLGVAGVEVTLDYLRNNLLAMPETPAVQTTYLLNSQGQIVSRSSDKSDSLELPTFYAPTVLQAIQQQKSGYAEEKRAGKKELIAYYRLNALGWYYVAVADVKKLLK